jgi:hypothetical protein
MTLEERPQLPLTRRRKALVAAGAMLFVAQVVAALMLAPMFTGPDDANPGAIVSLWGAVTLSSVVITLLLVRQADLPDIATAAMLVAIATFAAFTLSAAYDVRGTDDEVNMVDSLFLGVTSGALTALVVWGIAMFVARVLHLPTTERLHDEK